MSIKNIVPLVFCLLLSSIGHADTMDSCHAVYQPALAKLQELETELSKVNGKKMYQESVMNRYDTLEQLLTSASRCDSSKLSLEEQQDIHQIRVTLASLQASAQASAFTEFSDWLKAKTLDLDLCQRITHADKDN